jgi:hypothetical protein
MSIVVDTVNKVFKSVYFYHQHYHTVPSMPINKVKTEYWFTGVPYIVGVGGALISEVHGDALSSYNMRIQASDVNSDFSSPPRETAKQCTSITSVASDAILRIVLSKKRP